MNISSIKKDFAKTVTKIRKDLGSQDHPKAMMTGRQMELRTATVNCGGDYQPEYSSKVAEAVIDSPHFKAFLERTHGDAQLEVLPTGYQGKDKAQVRVTFPQVDD